MSHITAELQDKKIVLVISLDIEGAFDNAWWPAIKHQLILRKCPKNVYAMIDSYLKDRKIRVNYARETSERDTTKGCVQGSIGGPTFWNIILDPLLHQLSGEGVHCQAFADDVVLVFSGHRACTIQESANEALRKVERWGEDNKLKFAAHKTNVMLLTKKLKFDQPQLYMSGLPLNFVDSIKLLGLTIDNKLNFKAHVAAVCKKAADIYKQLARAAKVTWGLNVEIIRTIYVAVIEPIVLYAASAWSRATELQMIRNRLNSLQRGFAQKICKAYRTVSLTSALVLSGTLPLDLRIQEVASLYMAKRGLSQDYLPSGRKLEQRVSVKNLPHPSKLITTEYELLEEADLQTLNDHQAAIPHIYTDGSKIEGKVGAALTWWEKGEEIRHSTFSLDPSCTVFQSELYALHRAVQLAYNSGENLVNIMSDSRSSLDMLTSPKPSHPLAKIIKECIGNMREEGRQVRLFWLRAHVGTAGNERADELAKTAALQAATPDYDQVPLSFVKKKIIEESVRKWQDRYDSSSTGSVTRFFLPDVDKAYRIVRKIRLTHRQVQILTGHGGMGEYLHRFKLLTSPGCECDPHISESVWHLLLECPRFSVARMDLEYRIDTTLIKSQLPDILSSAEKRPHFLNYIEAIIRIASRRHTTLTHTSTPTPLPSQQVNIVTQALPVVSIHPLPRLNIIELGEVGHATLRLKGVALFMSDNAEKVGICFCDARGPWSVKISPGLASLLNGSTFKTSMKRKTYAALQQALVRNHSCRIVRSRNKTIALFDVGDEDAEFSQACKVLSGMTRGEEEQPRIISVDAMVVGYERANVADYIGVIKASDHHEVVVYEDRGENLSFLKPHSPEVTSANNPVDSWGHPVATTDGLSGSERFQERIASEEKEKRKSKSPKASGVLNTITDTISRAFTSVPNIIRKKVKNLRSTEASTSALEQFHLPLSKHSSSSIHRQPRTKADKGLVKPPDYRVIKEHRDHFVNAFVEYKAILKATMVNNTKVCRTILQTYHRKNEGLLKVRLSEAEAALYDNDSAQVIYGQMSSQYMAAFSLTSGFVTLDEEKSRRNQKLVFKTPETDPIVVVAKCTKVMLEEAILERAETLSSVEEPSGPIEHWTPPPIRWINGVPGCGKTQWIITNTNISDIIITTTREAATDLRERLQLNTGNEAEKRVRTMASLLVNGSGGLVCDRLLVDEALMNHFGAIVMSAKITGAREVVLMGDRNQLPYVERQNLFQLTYKRPDLVLSVNSELLCTHRNPVDVAYALNEIYSGMYSSSTRIRSLTLKRFTGAQIPKSLPNALYLTHTQADKELLIREGFGEGEGSRTLTIHEAQGLKCETTVIVRAAPTTLQLYSSVSHAVVAISRHTGSCVYYTDTCEKDATARLIQRAETATTAKLTDYNLRMAMRNRDWQIIESEGT